MDLTKLMKEAVRSDPCWPEVARTVFMNSRGRVWLIGGYVTRSLAAALYGSSRTFSDYDFVVEEVRSHPMWRPGWTVNRNRYGNQKFTYGHLSIDLIPITHLSHIHRLFFPFEEKTSSGAPLNIQSIAVDLNTFEVAGEVGITALFDKVVAVDDIAQAREFARKKERLLRDIISEKARDHGFRAEFPPEE